MSNSDTVKRGPLEGTQVTSAVATGGGGGVFQARVGALYLANMLTGLPTAFGLHDAQVELLRFEARYTGAHTDDIYCQLRDNEGPRLQLIQCKRGLDATPGHTDFVDGLQGAWRDFLRLEGSPFDRMCDVLVLATVAPGTSANRAAKRLCELSRASVDLADFLQKLDSKGFDAQHRRTWSAFKDVSKSTLADKYKEELVFDLMRRLRVDIHDLGSESSQEISLVQALLASGAPTPAPREVRCAQRELQGIAPSIFVTCSDSEHQSPLTGPVRIVVQREAWLPEVPAVGAEPLIQHGLPFVGLSANRQPGRITW